MESKALVPVETIEQKILLIRGQKVMLAMDLAELYEVETFNLNKAVKRNSDRFPKDFMFQLNNREVMSLRSHFVISKLRRGGRRYLPYAFTEQGVVMLSSVLNSKRAIQVNISIIRAFVRLRELFAANKEFASKLADLERKVGSHDEAIHSLVIAIKELMVQPEPKHRRIGFL
ncbi:ORF6N domain-containing protein [Candidatus Parvarchaeota archaeon]|nr:ORF6N domain-containing protein [Candidatus Parvarchaeota archaeon]